MNDISLVSERHYTCKYPSTEHFISLLAEHLKMFVEQNGSLENNHNELADSLECLAQLIEDDDLPTPEKYFELECYGHFKECYYMAPDFVIKFCAKRNPTLEEKQALDDVYKAGWGRVFLPSLYFELPHYITSDQLEKDDDDQEVYNETEERWEDNPKWEDNTVFTHICIQPRVRVQGDPDDDTVNELSTHSKNGWARTTKALGITHGVDPYDLAGLDGLDLTWAKAFADVYGMNRLVDLSALCAEFHIWDLHGENVGYARYPGSDIDYPIILDWMSR